MIFVCFFFFLAFHPEFIVVICARPICEELPSHDWERNFALLLNYHISPSRQPRKEGVTVHPACLEMGAVDPLNPRSFEHWGMNFILVFCFKIYLFQRHRGGSVG